MHDILLLISTSRGNYNINIGDFFQPTANNTRQGDRTELVVPKTRLRKTNLDFFIRTVFLVNIISRAFGKEMHEISKLQLSFVLERLSEADSCTWITNFYCGSCNPSGKLIKLKFIKLNNWLQTNGHKRP